MLAACIYLTTTPLPPPTSVLALWASLCFVLRHARHRPRVSHLRGKYFSGSRAPVLPSPSAMPYLYGSPYYSSYASPYSYGAYSYPYSSYSYGSAYPYSYGYGYGYPYSRYYW